MKKILLGITLSLFTFVISCKEEAQNTKMEEIMAVHDEVMPKMGRLGTLVGELKGMENDSTETGRKYQEARQDLQEANQAMMDWMQNFGNRFTSDEILNGAALPEKKKQWLNEEKEKVKAVRNQINSSIENAENLLGSTERP
ncbi:MAG TPA: hypothetical protein VFM69_07440 [Pricia sp.]|nr:hypothetical protein [Pricia sp.]